MTAMARSDTKELAALIGAKLKLVEILCRLGKQQLALIEAGELTGLVKLLAAKETVLAQLRVVEAALDPFRHEDPEQRQWPGAAERAACQARADRCNALLAETLELERQGEAAMLRRRDATSAALAGAHTAADARLAYMPHEGLGSAGSANLQVEG
jgi:hypothetical protein